MISSKLQHNIEHTSSYYAATRHAVEFPQLMGEHRVDVAIVGGGFTGVSAALFLAERGYNVATATELSGLAIFRLGAFFGETEDEGSGESFGATAELAVPVGERANLAVQLGVLSERETFLGSHTEGAFEIEGRIGHERPA